MAVTVFVRTFDGRRLLLTFDCGLARFEDIRNEVCRNSVRLPCFRRRAMSRVYLVYLLFVCFRVYLVKR